MKNKTYEKKYIKMKSLYFYEEDRDLLEMFETSGLNFQRISKKLLRSYLESLNKGDKYV